jgi:uncharacterized protein
MSEDFFRYDVLVQDAMRKVIRNVLSEAARMGLPSNHHFYVTFSTGAVGVRISRGLLAKYPGNITILLRHQYANLTVKKYYFSVELSFGTVQELLRIPFAAISEFADPSVPFHVQFHADASESDAGLSVGDSRKVVTVSRTTDVDVPVAANVISLDAFRNH